MEDKEKIYIDKSRIVNNVIIGTLTIVTSAIIILCLWTVAKPQINGTSVLSFSGNNKYLARFEEALNKLQSKYIDIDEVDMDELIDGAIDGMSAATGDPYTRYVTDEEFYDLATSGGETYGGIGIHLTYDTDKDAIIVLGVMPNTPALESGIKSGDLILQINDTVVNLENYQKCVDEMKGEENTTVKLYIKRNDEILEKEVTRRIITASNVESEIIDNVGYIKIWAFENKIYEQFKTEYEKLLQSNVSGIIIDVRKNPGGLVKETIEILDLLLPKGEVLKMIYNDGDEKVYKCDDDDQISVPLAVLVNGHSASAAEILSGAIKDSQKGVIIGEKTYGKGIVQEVERLGERGAMSITVAKYYTTSGVEIHKNGIEPNITVSLAEEYKNEMTIPKENDTQLQKAIEYVKSNVN